MGDNPALFYLFSNLRKALRLGPDDYLLLLHALQIGFGQDDIGSVERLCRTLWVKKPDHRLTFEKEFKECKTLIEQAMSELPKNNTPDKNASSENGQSDSYGEKLSGKTGKTQTSNGPSTPPDDSKPTIETNKQDRIAQQILKYNDDKVEAYEFAGKYGYKDLDDYWIALKVDYLPVSHRQLTQNWRHLRQPIREGRADEIDIKATVNRFGQTGLLAELMMRPRRVNRFHLVLLIDQDGSMVPFHRLSHRLAETVTGGGRLRKANVYYFHNVPVKNVYHTPYFFEARSMETFLRTLTSQYTAILIISDAGAARGGFNQDRLKETEKFLKELKQKTKRLAWLNPMPESRWGTSTAGAIAESVQMFELDSQGLGQAIRVIRGLTI